MSDGDPAMDLQHTVRLLKEQLSAMTLKQKVQERELQLRQQLETERYVSRVDVQIPSTSITT